MTSIEWTDVTWNPVRGCTRVSEGCRNCYAERIAARFAGVPTFAGFAIMADSGPRWTGKVELIESKLEEPLHWRKPRRVFVNSMSDLFHESLPLLEKERIFRVMLSAPQHRYQILTKRAATMAEQVPIIMYRIFGPHWQMPDCIWLGVSVEDQATADARIPVLLQTPAAVRFVSYEPALGPVDFTALQPKREVEVDALHGVYRPLQGRYTKLDWLICGGESGPGARPFDLGCARSARDQCKAAGVPFFMKQVGSAPYWEQGQGFDIGVPGHEPFQRLDLNDSKGGDMAEWPEDLRIREFPEAHPCR